MFPLNLGCSSVDGQAGVDRLRTLLVSAAKESAFRKVIQATMLRDRQHGPVMELNRMGGKKGRGKNSSGENGGRTVFSQMVAKMGSITNESLLLPHRVWKVKFVGESVDDCGGGYSESIAEICDELMQGHINILIPTPNGRDEAGTSRDCMLFHPSLQSPQHLAMFRFLGLLR